MKKQATLFAIILLGALVLFGISMLFLRKEDLTVVDQINIPVSDSNEDKGLTQTMGKSIENTDPLVPWNWSLVRRN